jgi:catechol 2,3-dioxygenase-like lactoylglutathione lyase family enzyme
MTLPLDHVVILVNDLERTIADCTALGFTVQRGGTHADGFTHNALVGFADGSYIELIAFLKPRPEHRWGRFASQGHQGFVDYALLPTTVAEVVARAKAGGVAYQGPLDGGRTRPDGQVLQWQIGTPPGPDLPFLCGDVTPRALRVREGAVRQHANGVTGVASVTVLVRDLAAAVRRYQALLGVDAATAVNGSGLGVTQALLPLGSAVPGTATPTLVLVTPGPDLQHPVAAALLQMLQARGEGIVGLALRGPATSSLSRQRTQGAAIDIVAA